MTRLALMSRSGDSNQQRHNPFAQPDQQPTQSAGMGARNPGSHQGCGPHQHAADSRNCRELAGTFERAADVPQIVHGMLVQGHGLGTWGRHNFQHNPAFEFQVLFAAKSTG